MPVQVIRPKTIGRGASAPQPFQRIHEHEGAIEEWIGKTKSALGDRKPAPQRGTMRLRMIRTRPGGVDGGIRVQIFEEGKVYDIEEPLALAFLRYGHAIEDKMVEAAPEVKQAVVPEIPEPPVTKPHKPIKRGKK